MKAAYQTMKLGDLCHIARGGSPRPIQDYLTDAPNGINWVKISDATASDKYIEYTKEKIRPDGLKKSRLVRPGDFILSNSMSFGRPYIMKTTGCIHDGWLVLSDKCGLFDPDFLYHFLGSDAAYRQFDGLAAGSTVRNLNSDLVKTVDVPIPPLEEQRRIVAVLDKAFAGIATATANAQRNLTNARALFKSYLQSIFSNECDGWSFRNFEDCLQKIKYTTKIQRKDFKEAGDFPIVSQEADFINGYWDQKDDVLRVKSPIVVFGDHTQVLKYVDFDFVLGADGVKLLLPIPAISAKFLLYFLKANPINSIGYARHYRLLKELNVGFPALPEQAKITGRLDHFSQQIDQLEEVYGTKVLALTELKRSLLQKAFAGELT